MRFYDETGEMLADLLYLEDEEDELIERISLRSPIHFNHPSTDYSGMTLKSYAHTRKLLLPVMVNGKITMPFNELNEIRKHRAGEIESLDETYRRLLNPHTYKVSLSDNLKQVKTELIKKIQYDFYY